MLSSYTIVSICINLSFYMLAIDSSYEVKDSKIFTHVSNISLVRPVKNKQTVYESSLRECVLCVTG